MSDSAAPSASGAVTKREGPSLLRSVTKAAILVVALGACFAIVYFTPLRSILKHFRETGERLREMGWMAPVVFTAAVAALVAVGIPRLLLCPVAGMAFGFWWGLLWTQIGTILGSYATFLFVQWGGRDFVLRKWPRLERVANAVDRQGTLAVLLVRQLPLGGFYINILLGLTRLRHVPFLIGTAIGILPEAVPMTLLGAGVIQQSFEATLAYILTAGAAIIAAAFLARWYLFKKRPAAAEALLGNATEENDGGEEQR